MQSHSVPLHGAVPPGAASHEHVVVLNGALNGSGSCNTNTSVAGPLSSFNPTSSDGVLGHVTAGELSSSRSRIGEDHGRNPGERREQREQSKNEEIIGAGAVVAASEGSGFVDSRIVNGDKNRRAGIGAAVHQIARIGAESSGFDTGEQQERAEDSRLTSNGSTCGKRTSSGSTSVTSVDKEHVKQKHRGVVGTPAKQTKKLKSPPKSLSPQVKRMLNQCVLTTLEPHGLSKGL